MIQVPYFSYRYFGNQEPSKRKNTHAQLFLSDWPNEDLPPPVRFFIVLSLSMVALVLVKMKFNRNLSFCWQLGSHR